jgi:hypothetical protein
MYLFLILTAITRMSGCQITVDGKMCYTFPSVDASHGGLFDNITCNQPLRGQRIRIKKGPFQRPWRDNYTINICEVEVYAEYGK